MITLCFPSETSIPLLSSKRNTATFRERLKATGLPEVLTIAGRPDVVVQSAEAYQRSLDIVERAETLLAVQEGIEDMKAGRMTTLEGFDHSFRSRHKLPGR